MCIRGVEAAPDNLRVALASTRSPAACHCRHDCSACTVLPAGTEAGAAADVGGVAGAAAEAPGGFGGEPDAGFSSGFGAQQAGGGFGDDAESFKWDDVAGGMSGGGGDEESTSGLWGILVGLWAMIFGE